MNLYPPPQVFRSLSLSIHVFFSFVLTSMAMGFFCFSFVCSIGEEFGVGFQCGILSKRGLLVCEICGGIVYDQRVILIESGCQSDNYILAFQLSHSTIEYSSNAISFLIEKKIV